jgi:tRNA(Ile)-lysidine synthase
MLAALTRLRSEYGFVLHCLHVEHGIRPAAESRGDAEAVKALCKELDVPCRVVSVVPGRIAEAAKRRGLGIEGAARLYRHAAWNREAARLGAARVLAAHTRDDFLETVLMRVLRGSGPRGLASISGERGRVLRPLLDLSREDVLAYLAERGISYRTDSTNADPAFLRNRIRNTLIPCLNEGFPSWKKGVAALAETQALTADFLEAEAAARLPWTVSDKAKRLELSRAVFFAQGEIIREEALFLGIDRLTGGEPRRSSLRLFTRGEKKSVDLGSARITCTEDRGILSAGCNQAHETGFSLLIKEPGLYKLDGISIEVMRPSPRPKGEGNGFFAGLPLVLRPAYGDDYIRKPGRRISKPTGLVRKRASEYTDIITALDAQGVAAFIGTGANGWSVLAGREENGTDAAGREPAAMKEASFFFTLFGGIDVQRSE